MKIVVDNQIPFIKGVLEKYAEVTYLEGRNISNNDLRDADAIIIRTRTKCNSKLLDGTKVKFIASATIGFDHIDTAYCRANNISWTNAEGCNSSSVKQYISAALFYIAKKYNFRLSDKTIGIVGVGHVGKKVAAVCEALGMHLLLNDPPRERLEGPGIFVPLDEIVEHSDIITLHVPLNYEGEDKTFHMIDEKFISRLKKHKILFNSARGEVIDTKAVKSALKNRILSACVLDVWENEPGIDTGLLQSVDIGTPHIAGYSADGKANGTSMSVNSLSRFFGLNIRDWFPENIPFPEKTLIEFDCKNLTQEEIISELVRFTYDISSDDLRLRSFPSGFEKQRENYPLRREFPAYSVRLLNHTENTGSLAAKIGFKLIN